MLVNQAHFTKEFARPQYRQNDFLAFRVGDLHLDPPRNDDEHILGGLAFAHDHTVLGVSLFYKGMRQIFELAIVQAKKNRYPA